MKLSVIIPVHNGGEKLGRCLDALIRSASRPEEVIVVDDASTDGSAELALRHGAQVVGIPAPSRGPAFARNRGAEVAGGEILFFTDADVLLHPDAIGLAKETLEKDASIDACFGSYDDTPAAGGLVSQYKNLLHHHVHQHGAENAATFWSGCGAIRRTAFQDAGGFDESYKKPSTEDVDLGIRLRRQGKQIRLLKAMQATHLKRWTLRALLRSDILQRAVPWSRMILAERGAPKDLNLNASARWSAAAVLAFLASGIAGFWYPLCFFIAAAMGLTVFLLNLDLYLFFGRKRGWLFMARAIPMHWLYYFYSAATFACVLAAALASGALRRRTPATPQELTAVIDPSETSHDA